MMSEENNLIYCSQCGRPNPATFKFCSNCGVKLEQPQTVESQQPARTGYEKAEGEVVSEGRVPLTRGELDINYDRPEEENYASGSFSSADTPRYYSANTETYGYDPIPEAGSNKGFAIGSMICGIVSIVSCCLSWFSLVLGIAAIVLGIIALSSKYEGRGMAITGIVTGGVGIFIWLIVMLLAGSMLLF